ncbi:MAG: hypothetical protein HYY02_01620 [Chloroflexi bacterium]|nr:hypothetical protein [Chloroflexota bacterium]
MTASHRQQEEERYQAWWAQAAPLFESNDRNRFSGWPILEVSDAPWTPLKKPLRQARLALLCSGGIYLPPQPRFDDIDPQGDYTWRAIPLDADPSALRLAHTHYDHAAAAADIGVVYPVERLMELAAEGVCGQLSDPVYTWHGYVTHLAHFRDTAAQELAARVVSDGADAALLVPV